MLDKPISFPSVLYVDTLVVLVMRRLPDKLIHYLRRKCGTLRVDEVAKSEKDKYPKWRYRIEIRQPTVQIIEMLSILPERYGVLVSRLDVALDVFAHDPIAAMCLREWLQARVVMRWGRTPIQPSLWESTVYLGDGEWDKATLAIYQDLGSKVNGQHCVHLELRLKGARTVRGCKKLVNHITHVCADRLVEIYQHRIAFAEIRPHVLAKQYLRYCDRTRQYSDYQRRSIAHRLLLITRCNQYMQATASGIIHEYGHAPWFDRRTSVPKLPYALVITPTSSTFPIAPHWKGKPICLAVKFEIRGFDTPPETDLGMVCA